MKLRRVQLHNFMVYSDADLHLNEKSTVLFGINGVGKSSLLRAINLLYANIINGTVNRKELRQQYNIELSDIRYGKPDTRISGSFVLCDGDETAVEYWRGMVRKNGKREHIKANLDIITNTVQGAYQSDLRQGNIPVFVNYGTNRLVLDIPLRIRAHHEFDVYSAYEKAIENRIDFRTFFEWYRNQEDEENSVKVETKNLNYEDRALQAVKRAVLAMMPGMEHLHIARKPRLAMMVEKDGMNLNVSQLSDGEKCMLAMLGDLARRLSVANPTLDDPLLGTGVVLIDEIELHMHPSWQRKILRVLSETFPNIQFIVTTHSPQILGEADDNYNLFALRANGHNDTVIDDKSRLDGFDSNYILEEFMHTSCKSDAIKKLISDINLLISQRKYDRAEKALDKLKLITGEMSEDYILATGFLKRSRLNDEKN